jgi:hypothetical protein
MSSQPFYLKDLFWRIIGLIALRISILVEMRKSRHMFDNLIEYLGGSTQSSIDEKIAVLYSYVMTVPHGDLLELISI